MKGNVCGLDVHKDNVFVCILKEDGEKILQRVGILTPELDALRDMLVSHGVAEVCMESTSIYWMPVWRVLDSDFHLWLVNPLAIKQLPGRKSDVKDAEWIATCLKKDLVRGSYVPEEVIQQLRQYDRRIFEEIKDSVKILETVGYDVTGNIIYPVAQITNPDADDAETAAAADFIAFITNDDAKALYQKYGFDTNVE